MTGLSKRAALAGLASGALMLWLLAGGAQAASQPTTSKATGNLGAISCPTATLCYAAGTDGHKAVLDTIKNGKQVKSRTANGMEDFIGVSCPTASFCQMTGDATGGQAAVMTFSGSKFGKVVKPGFSAWQISCFKASHCVIAGFGDGSTPTLETAAVSNGKVGKPHTHVMHSPVQTVTVYGISCASSKACEVAGNVTSSGAGGGIESFYAGLGKGASIGKVHVVPSPPAKNGLSLGNGIACPHGKSTCYVGASNENGDLLMSVQIGGSKLKTVSVPTMLATYIACDTLRYCTGAGAGNGAVPAVQSFVNGKPGKEEDFGSAFGPSFAAVARPSPSTWVAIEAEAGVFTSTIVSGAPS
jgi:hypothetical protein